MDALPLCYPVYPIPVLDLRETRTRTPRRCRLRRRGLSRRRRPDERIGFVALSRGAHPSSTPITTMRDLCLMLSRVDACRLPATRAQEFVRTSLARQPYEATKFEPSHHGKRRPSHRGTCARRVARLLPCPLPSSEAPSVASGSQATAVRRVARRIRPLLSSLDRPRFLSRAAQRSLVGSLIAMPCLSALDSSVGNPPATSSASVLRTASSTASGRGTAGGDDQQSLGARRRSARSRMPASIL